MTPVKIFTDGATLGHNGKLGTVHTVGLGIWIPHLGQGLARKAQGISNNEAEFKALILAMKLAVKMEWKVVNFYLDSKIVVNRANGARPKKAKHKNERMDAFQCQVQDLEDQFILCTFNWIPRESNVKADFYSKKALY